MRNRIFGVTTSLLVAALTFTVVAWGADNNVGTWKANLAKSKYSPGPAPKSQTLTIEAHEGGIKYTARANDVMLVFMFSVLIAFIVLAVNTSLPCTALAVCFRFNRYSIALRSA